MAERGKRSAVATPDGGWGWMIVASCFITTICTRAVTRCVSIFFVEFHTHFSSDYSSTAWIHSLVDSTTMLCAPLGSSIGNHFSCRVAVMVGGLLSSAGLILSSFATSLEYLYLSLGILTGVGFALCYTPAIAIVGTYFSERKALAYGIAMSGSGIGTFILAPVVQVLIEIYSWQGALLILGGLVSHLCVCGALMRPLGTQKQKHRSEDIEVDMLYSQLAEDELHMELNLDESKAPELEMAELDGSAVTVRETSGETSEEYEPDEEQEQESLLKNGENSNQEEAKFIHAGQRDTTLKEKECLEERMSTEEQMVADIDKKNDLNHIDSKLPGATKGISVKDTSTYTNSKSTNLSESTVSNQKTQTDTKQSNFLITDSKLQSVSADSKLPDLRPTESMLADSEPNDSTLASLSLDDLILSDLKLPEPVHADSELSSSKTSGSIQADPERNDSRLAELMLANSALTDLKLEAKLADSRLLCKLNCCESLNLPTDKSTESRETYGFLLLPDFLLLSVSFLFLAFGCSVPFVYLVPYSLSVGACSQQAALLMSILGVMGIVGNITFGWISDRKCLRAYRKGSYLLAVAFDGLGCLFVPLLRDFSLLVPFALVYGYFDGAYVALLPVVTSDTVGPTYLSSALGVVYFIHAIPYLISPPIGGWLVDQTGSYTAAFLLSGCSFICSALILAVVTLVRCCGRRPSQSYLK